VKTKTTFVLLAMMGSTIALYGCNSGSGGENKAEAAQQKQQAQQNFNNLPPEVRPGGGPGK
jgi:hypothetical protein